MARLTSSDKPVSIRYKKLTDLEHQVRVLEIQPSRNLEDVIVSRLITVSLRKPSIEIIGLSSLIGDAEITEIIYIDGKPTKTTAHRGQALRHMREVFLSASPQPRGSSSSQVRRNSNHRSFLPQRLLHLLGVPEPKLYVWSDAFCINQREDAETNHYKDTMKMVYQSAKVVLGWLGPKSDSTDLGLTVIAQIDDCMPRFWGDPGDKDLHPENYTPTHEWATKIQDLWRDAEDGTPSFMLPHWVGANDFMYRPFFQKQCRLLTCAQSSYDCLYESVLVTTRLWGLCT